MEWCPAGWSVCLPLLIFPCTTKSRSSILAPAHPGGPGKRAVKRLWWWWFKKITIWDERHRSFYGPDALPVIRQTVSAYWRKLKAPTPTRRFVPANLILSSSICENNRVPTLLIPKNSRTFQDPQDVVAAQQYWNIKANGTYLLKIYNVSALMFLTWCCCVHIQEVRYIHGCILQHLSEVEKKVLGFHLAGILCMFTYTRCSIQDTIPIV